MSQPTLLEAPSHRDPYGFYGRLAVAQPFFRDQALNCWVAAGAAAVQEVLTHPTCHTRPAHKRVPARLAEGAMGDLFGRLVRLRDDPARDPIKRAIVSALRGLDMRAVAEVARERALALDRALGPGPLDEVGVNRFMLALPVQVVACLLGIAPERHHDVLSWLGDYGDATAAVLTRVPAPEPGLLARGHRAAEALQDLVRERLRGESAPGPLLASLAAEARQAGVSDPEDVVANGVGMLLQADGAVASLIALTLLSIARHPSLRARLGEDPSLLRRLIQEVLRFDPGTSSTVRFMAADGVVAGQALRAGEMIVVLIAAANHDPALNAEPQRFAVDRAERKHLEFGAGAHACPADRLAPFLAEIAVVHLLSRGAPIDRLEAGLYFAPSGYLRMPRFRAAA